MNIDSVRAAMLVEIFNSLSANNTDEKILDFADVPEGWHFGEGSSISTAAIRDAAKLHDALLLNGFYETDAFPGLAGEIRVTAYHQNQYLEFTREANGEWSYVYEVGGDIDDEQDSLTLDQAQFIVIKASEKIWNTSAISQGNTGTRNYNDSRVLPSVHQATAAYRSWNSLVPYSPERSATTSGYFIQAQESRPYFGHSKIQYCQSPRLLSSPRATQATHATGMLLGLPKNSQRSYLKHTVINPTTLKYVWGPNQDASALQTSLPLDWSTVSR